MKKVDTDATPRLLDALGGRAQPLKLPVFTPLPPPKLPLPKLPAHSGGAATSEINATERNHVARTFVTDAAALIGKGGARLNELRSRHPHSTIQLTSSEPRELIVRGARDDVEAIAAELHTQARLFLGAFTPRTDMQPQAAASFVPTARVHSVFVHAARGVVPPLTERSADTAPPPAPASHETAQPPAPPLQPRPPRPPSCGGGRRRSVPWSHAEEKALRKGVQAHGSGSWARILLDGGFKSCRTGPDLRVKARQMRL